MLREDPSKLASLAELHAERCLSAAFRAAHPEATAEVGAWVNIVEPRVFSEEIAGFAEMPSLLDDISRMDARFYLRVGALDTTAPPAWSHEIARRAKHAVVDVIDGCGHALFVEDALATEAALERALA